LQSNSDSDGIVHGIPMVTSTDSIQDYFKKKMADKLSRLKSPATDRGQDMDEARPTFNLGAGGQDIEARPTFNLGAGGQDIDEARPTFNLGAGGQDMDEARPSFILGDEEGDGEGGNEVEEQPALKEKRKNKKKKKSKRGDKDCITAADDSEKCGSERIKPHLEGKYTDVKSCEEPSEPKLKRKRKNKDIDCAVNKNNSDTNQCAGNIGREDVDSQALVEDNADEPRKKKSKKDKKEKKKERNNPDSSSHCDSQTDKKKVKKAKKQR